MTWDGVEKRQHKRLGIKGCTLQYKSAKCLGIFSIVSNRYLVLNISPIGLSFISKEELQPMDTLFLSVTAPLLNGEIIRLKGRVIWIKESPQYHAYRTGIEFINTARRARQRLKIILDNALLDQIDLSTRVYLKEVDKL